MPLGGKGPVTIAVLCVEVALAGLFIGLRWFTRRFMRGSVGLDDYILLASWLIQVLFVAFFVAASLSGFGQHVSILSAKDIVMATKMTLIGQFTVSLAMGLSKVAVAMFLMRIVVEKWHKWVLWFWITTMMFFSVLLAVSVFAQCTPVASLWDVSVPVEGCTLDLTTIAYVMCTWSFVMDFFLALVPWYVLRNLNMSKREKRTICVSLSLGVFAGVCGIIRTSGLGALNESTDYLYATADSVMWTSSELTLTIMCVSIPAMRPLWARYLGNGSSTDRYYRQTDGACTGSSNMAGFDGENGAGRRVPGAQEQPKQKQPSETDESESESFRVETIIRAGDNGASTASTSEPTTPVGSGGGGGGGGGRSRSHTLKGPTRESIELHAMYSDSRSDRSILRDSKGIQRSHEITVQYSPGRNTMGYSEQC